MSKKNRVDFMYGLAKASWYDPFRRFWTHFICQQAESDLTNALKEICTKKTTILDLGCGTGFNISRLIENNIPYGHYTGLDGNSHMLDIAKKKFSHLCNITLRQQDITKTTNDKADVILCTWVMSHLEQPAAVINQWQSALNPGGIMLCIFLSKPHWSVDAWLRPLAYASQCTYVNKKQISKIENLSDKHSYSKSLVTYIVCKPEMITA